MPNDIAPTEIREAYLELVRQFVMDRIPNMSHDDLRKILMDVFSTDFMATRRLIKELRNARIRNHGNPIWIEGDNGETDLDMGDLGEAIKEMGLE